MPKIEINVHIILVTPLRSFCGSRFSWFAAQPAFTIGLDVVGSQSSVVPVTCRMLWWHPPQRATLRRKGDQPDAFTMQYQGPWCPSHALDALIDLIYGWRLLPLRRNWCL